MAAVFRFSYQQKGQGINVCNTLLINDYKSVLEMLLTVIGLVLL
jgi:hypothetical protein